MKIRNLIILIISLLLIFGAFYINSLNKNNINKVVHEHADFKVFINNQEIDFSQEKYMLRANDVHVENMKGNEIHKHASGITLGYFFNTLGIEFNENCFVIEREYCNDDNNELKLYVNNLRNYEYDSYEISDNDKILISYGSESEEEIQGQINSI